MAFSSKRCHEKDDNQFLCFKPTPTSDGLDSIINTLSDGKRLKYQEQPQEPQQQPPQEPPQPQEPQPQPQQPQQQHHNDLFKSLIKDPYPVQSENTFPFVVFTFLLLCMPIYMSPLWITGTKIMDFDCDMLQTKRVLIITHFYDTSTLRALIPFFNSREEMVNLFVRARVFSVVIRKEALLTMPVFNSSVWSTLATGDLVCGFIRFRMVAETASVSSFDRCLNFFPMFFPVLIARTKTGIAEDKAVTTVVHTTVCRCSRGVSIRIPDDCALVELTESEAEKPFDLSKLSCLECLLDFEQDTTCYALPTLIL
jgi:hypothetical protein